MKSITVTDIKITSFKSKIKDPAFGHLLPKNIFPEHMEFNILNVSNAVSNGIRRTITCELLVNSMICNYEDIETNDMFIIREQIIKRIRTIPVDQKTPLDTMFSLVSSNETAEVRDIKSGEIKIIKSKSSGTHKLPFNETFTLFTLQPGKFIKISNITMNPAFGYNSDDGMHVVAFNAASTALDQEPINAYVVNSTGIPSRISNPREWKISFNTNGTMPPKQIIFAACDNLISRITSVRELLTNIENNGDEFTLTVVGESDTIGNLFERTICDLYPNIKAVSYSCSNVDRSLTVRIRTDDDIKNIFDTTIKEIIAIYTKIKKYFE